MLTSTPPEGKDSAAKTGSQALNPGSLNAATKFSGAGSDSAVNKGEVTGVLTQTVADSPSSFTAGGHACPPRPYEGHTSVILYLRPERTAVWFKSKGVN